MVDSHAATEPGAESQELQQATLDLLYAAHMASDADFQERNNSGEKIWGYGPRIWTSCQTLRTGGSQDEFLRNKYVRKLLSREANWPLLSVLSRRLKSARESSHALLGKPGVIDLNKLDDNQRANVRPPPVHTFDAQASKLTYKDVSTANTPLACTTPANVLSPHIFADTTRQPQNIGWGPPPAQLPPQLVDELYAKISRLPLAKQMALREVINVM